MTALEATQLELTLAVALVAPLGLNPLLALGTLGLASMLLEAQPLGATFAGLAHPALWGPLLAGGLIINFGRSFSLTKPVAELLGTGESLLGVLSVALLFMEAGAAGPTAQVAQAGFGSQVLLVLAGVASVSVIIALRMALDLLTWISPLPFLDALFQGAKLVVTLGLLALAAAFPELALAMNVLFVVSGALALRWAIKLALTASKQAWEGTRSFLSPPVQPEGEG